MSSELSRRTLVITSLTTGFALATLPVSAETIRTSSEPIVAGEVSIGGIPAYRAMPAGKGSFPLVLVVHEIFGVHEHIKDVCRRLAHAGYMAIAPELFARHGDVSKLQGFDAILKVVGKAPDAQVMKDLDDTLAWAKKGGQVADDRVAITGFCWGGRIVWLYASRPGIKAGIAFYGRLSHAVNANQSATPLDIGAKLKAPVLGLYGGKDTGIPLSHVELMRREITKANNGSEIVVYPDAQHAFFADYRATYSKAAAEDAWKKLLGWLTNHGV